jgi:putative tricarboxylic transport membrane protein
VRGRDLGAAAVLLAFGLFALSQARGLRFGSIVSPGPGFFPLCLAAALTLVSVALVVRAVRMPPTAVGPASGAHAAGRLKAIGTLGSLVVYALVLEWLGFLLATFVLLLFFFKALQRQRWLAAVGGSLATSLVTYLVFKVWLGVNLPAGLSRF